MDPIDGRLVLQDLYETEYGIYNHLSGSRSRPLASVAMHDVEDINDGSLLEEAARLYAMRKINTTYGYNFSEFLELPRDVIDILISVANEEQTKKSNIVSELEQQFTGER